MKETENVPGEGNSGCESPEVLHKWGKLQIVQYSFEMGAREVEMKNQ